MNHHSHDAATEEPDFLHRLIRAAVPSRIRFIFYYLRQALASNGTERRENLARMYAHMGWRQHDVMVHGDVRLTVDIRDGGTGMPLWTRGIYETPLEKNFLESTLAPSHVFIDIGANIGYYTTLAAKCVGPSGRIVAIEPSPCNFSLLTRNIRRNNFKNVTPVQVALSDRPGKATLHLSKANWGDNRIGTGLSQLGEFESDTVEISTDTLDNVLRRLRIDRVDCIKMDVQGFEAYVLDGMLNTVARGISTISTEFWPPGIRAAGKDPALFLAKFKDLGFTAHIMDTSGLKPIAFDRVIDAVPKANRPDAEWVNLVFRASCGYAAAGELCRG